MNLLAVLLACVFCVLHPAVAASPSPVGVWRTFDDDGRETGRVEITERNQRLYGRITAIADPAKAKAICRDCTDERRGLPVVGLEFLRGLRQDGDVWDGGDVLDPQNGRVYRCSLRLEDGGRKLVIRGYIGLSLFGRSQTWVRVE
jgi:uncharacterized protein (DUF2147 family)